uniref:WGS project CBMG000000000 data, contig CS5907-c002993 n=1 Tax=Fusarium acuminatum CS5907 TaxID=1318461 RepID=A0A090M9R6_9HYPO|nr:unnamed protein product [Fusarium acuminatum CS5907]
MARKVWAACLQDGSTIIFPPCLDFTIQSAMIFQVFSGENQTYTSGTIIARPCSTPVNRVKTSV